MAMNPNMAMQGMNPMGGPVGGAPMPMMGNGNITPQVAAAAAARQQQMNETQRGVFNTYIYEYFMQYRMWDCARSLLQSNEQVNVHKDGARGRRDENGNIINGVDDSMDTDAKDEDSKVPDDLPPAKLAMPVSDTSFLFEWFCVFFDIYNAQKTKGGNATVNQYVAHTQAQSRMKQSQQQEMLRQMRPGAEMTPQQFQQAQLMRNMQNGNMAMGMKPGMNQGNLARTAMANNQTNPHMQMLQQQAKNQMQPGPQDRPTSPTSADNAPSPSKRPRIDGQPPFNPNQPGMMPNGRPPQAMPGQPMPAAQAQAAHQLLHSNGINPSALNPAQLAAFINSGPNAQAKSIASYSQNLQQHHGSQMGNKGMPNAGPQSQGSPSMMQNGPDIAAFYNAADIGGAQMRAGANGAPNQPAGSSNHALQDYQMQLMLLEQQNKKRLMMARQEQDNIGGAPAPGQPGGPQPGQFPDASPQAMRTGTSPNPADQMKRGTPQMNNSGIPSPVPEGGSRGSPNPAMNFMGDPNMAPQFMAAQQMSGMRPPPSSHPGAQFNGMNPQMMAARQASGQGAPGQWQQGQPPPGQPGPNGQMPQGMPGQPPQGTPQQRAMGPPSAPVGPAAAGNANNRTTASPQQAAAAPPTPSQTNKAAPKKKKETAKEKRAAANKKNNANNNNNAAAATPAGDNAEGDANPATPMTPANANFKGNGAAPAQSAPPAVPNAAAVMPAGQDPSQNGGMDFSNMGGDMTFADPLQSSDVLNDFDFDAFLHDGEGNDAAFDFNSFGGMDGAEIGAESNMS